MVYKMCRNQRIYVAEVCARNSSCFFFLSDHEIGQEAYLMPILKTSHRAGKPETGLSKK